MNAKISFRIAALAAAALLASACIYPYTVDIQRGGDYPMVIEGDIHVGGITTVKLSHVRPFKLEDNRGTTIRATGYIEGEDGSRVGDSRIYYSDEDPTSPSTTLEFDTSQLRENQRYRLHFETYSNSSSVSNIYESDWLTPCPAPTIDALTYSKRDDFKELWIGLTMHCNGQHYFRWTFTETWQYHSDLHSYIQYVPSVRTWASWKRDWIVDVPGYYQRREQDLYYCWNTVASSQINIFSTVNQTEDRFEELAFHTIPLTDKRLQVLYRITVLLEAQSESAYNYWNNIQQTSGEQGSIFAPVPSEMASNVHCVTDPSIQVMGYLNAAVQAKTVLYYDNEKEGFFIVTSPMDRGDEKVEAGDYYKGDSMFDAGFLPYQSLYEGMSSEPSHSMWARAICIDCRKQGGTKSRPEDWPRGDF